MPGLWDVCLPDLKAGVKIGGEGRPGEQQAAGRGPAQGERGRVALGESSPASLQPTEPCFEATSS